MKWWPYFFCFIFCSREGGGWGLGGGGGQITVP